MSTVLPGFQSLLFTLLSLDFQTAVGCVLGSYPRAGAEKYLN